MTVHPLRWGVLGTARIGRVAVNPAIQASHNGVLVAVASRDEGRAREFVEAMAESGTTPAAAHESGLPRPVGSYEALLEDPEVDAVYIPLPNSEHREWTVKAAEAGKHVLCEKPLALSPAECREMEEAARSNGVHLMEAFMYRFHPRTERLVELVRDGAAGEVRVVRSAFSFRLDRPGDIRFSRALGGGALMDVGCYCVNAARTVLGAEPLAVQASAHWTEGYQDGGPETAVDDEMTALLHFPEGVKAHFDCAFTMERSEFVEVAGTEGVLRVESSFRPGSGDVVIREQRGAEEVREHRVPGDDQYRRMVEHFADCVLRDRTVRYPASEARANMAVIHALYRSALAHGGPADVEPTRSAYGQEASS